MLNQLISRLLFIKTSYGLLNISVVVWTMNLFATILSFTAGLAMRPYPH
jgi:hypothetical protein